MSYCKITLLGLLLCSALPLAAAAAPARPGKLVFAMTESAHASPQGLLVQAIYQEIFAPLGIAIDITPLPTKRASVLLKSGVVDGDIHRSLAYGQLHPELVRVEQAHFSVRYAAYGKLAQPPVRHGWEELAARPVRIDYILGSVKPEQELGKPSAAARVATVKTVEQGLRKLEAGHSDILVALDLSTDPLLDSALFRQTGIARIGTLEQVDGYLYLQAKHAWLAPEIASALLRMKRAGRIEKLREQVDARWQAGQR